MSIVVICGIIEVDVLKQHVQAVRKRLGLRMFQKVNPIEEWIEKPMNKFLDGIRIIGKFFGGDKK